MSKLVIKKNQIPDQNLRASQSSYGHSGSGSGYGDHGSYSSGGGDCCPLVVDPLTYAALLAFLALATYFFNVLIAMSMLMKKRKKRGIDILIEKGKIIIVCLIMVFSPVLSTGLHRNVQF